MLLKSLMCSQHVDGLSSAETLSTLLEKGSVGFWVARILGRSFPLTRVIVQLLYVYAVVFQ